MQFTKQISFIFVSLFALTFIISCSSIGTASPTQEAINTINEHLHDEFVLLIEVENDSIQKYSSPKLTIDDWECDIEPLFPPELLSEITDANGYKAETTWFVVSTSIKNTNKEQSHPWDLAHDFLKKAYNAGYYDIKHIEPDIPNNWHFHDLRENKNNDIPGCETLKPITYWPYKQEFAWHLDKEYSQLRKAREFVAAQSHDMIRIAHIDTGYDPDQMTFPQDRMRVDLQRNFYLKDNPDPYNASDPGTMGPFHVYGHGTGTLSLLAGGYINWPSQYGFPDFNDFLGANNSAEVVPVRVADSVVLFYSRNLARGILYAIAPRNNRKNKCDVISLSMGGVASKTWAYAVNHAYEAGVAIFAASGDRFGKSPPATTVYPARFNRVVSVCGVTEKYKPYYKKCNLTKCQESFGPDSKMDTAISTFAKP